MSKDAKDHFELLLTLSIHYKGCNAMYVKGFESELYSILGPSIQSNVTHVRFVESVKYCTTFFCTNKRSKVYRRC